jgi:hypothetical protein
MFDIFYQANTLKPKKKKKQMSDFEHRKNR